MFDSERLTQAIRCGHSYRCSTKFSFQYESHTIGNLAWGFKIYHRFTTGYTDQQKSLKVILSEFKFHRNISKKIIYCIAAPFHPTSKLNAISLPISFLINGPIICAAAGAKMSLSNTHARWMEACALLCSADPGSAGVVLNMHKVVCEQLSAASAALFLASLSPSLPQPHQ